VNVQGREEAETRVARAIYACGMLFNVVQSPYWQDMVRAINTAPSSSFGSRYLQPGRTKFGASQLESHLNKKSY